MVNRRPEMGDQALAAKRSCAGFFATAANGAAYADPGAATMFGGVASELACGVDGVYADSEEELSWGDRRRLVPVPRRPCSRPTIRRQAPEAGCGAWRRPRRGLWVRGWPAILRPSVAEVPTRGRSQVDFEALSGAVPHRFGLGSSATYLVNPLGIPPWGVGSPPGQYRQ